MTALFFATPYRACRRDEMRRAFIEAGARSSTRPRLRRRRRFILARMQHKEKRLDSLRAFTIFIGKAAFLAVPEKAKSRCDKRRFVPSRNAYAKSSTRHIFSTAAQAHISPRRLPRRSRRDCRRAGAAADAPASI